MNPAPEPDDARVGFPDDAFTRRSGETAQWLVTPRGCRHAMWNLPCDAPERAVLILPPLFEERKSCARVLAQTARRLCRDGALVLRFDYRATGDSPGGPGEGTPAEWIEDIRAVHAILKQRAAGVPVAWLSVRFATRLAMAALDRAIRPDTWLAWVPVLCGARALDEGLQRRRIQRLMTGRSAETVLQARRNLEAGQVLHVDGVDLTPALTAQFQALGADRHRADAAGLAAGIPFRAWLPHADPRTSAVIRNIFPRAGVEILRMAPFWHAVGLVETQALEDRTAAALRKTGRGGCAAAAPGGWAPTGEARVRSDPGLPRHIALTVGESIVRGLYHAPAGGDSRPCGVILMLHGWAGCRLGPQRFFVRMAEALSSRGYGCLRIDFRGRGDSDPPRNVSVSVRTQSEDACAAVAVLRDHLAPGLPLTLLGICSGTKAALSAATRAPDVHRLVLLSAEPMGRLRPRNQNRRKTAHAIGVYLRKICRVDTWRKLVRGRLHPDMIRKAVIQHETRAPDEARFENETLDRMTGWPGDILFVYGGADPDASVSETAYRQWVRRQALNAEFRTIASANHNFSDPEWERQVIHSI